MRRGYNNNDFLSRAFSDDTELLTRELKPTLLTLNMTLELSNLTSISDLPRATKAQKSRNTTQGMQKSNIQKEKRERKLSEKAKARLQTYYAALSSLESLQAVHTAFEAGISYKPSRIH
ncbi:MAG: hypothetical protein M1813_009079 [Trichoglossum hirsutum]|nr:MAG: hypothetical protein M1813_009079 [Trichoglossum hirsutum]